MADKNFDTNILQQPVELLQKLIMFNTTNPPGSEAACIKYIDKLLKQVGIKTKLLAKNKERPNLTARLQGRGSTPPLLLYGHVDVVPTADQEWRHPPFAGEIADGFIWGRGALDMKSGVAMMLNAFTRAKISGASLPGDVVLCIVGDEENAGEFGARFLVENHAELFKDIRYALGEVGGFTFYIGNKKFYLIQVAEKQVCHIRVEIHGPGGHGAVMMRGGAMAKLARVLDRLERKYLPVHITPTVRMMISAMAEELPFPKGLLMRQLLKPGLTDSILKKLGETGLAFAPLFHNTANATMVRGGEKINVIPGEIELKLDVRLLPGFNPEDVKTELRALLGAGTAFEVLAYQPGSGKPDMGLFPTLAGILKAADPGGIPVPILLPGTTDGRFFSRLGIQTYGCTPMQLPAEMNFNRLIHAADERIPVESLKFGSDVFFQVLQRFNEPCNPIEIDKN